MAMAILGTELLNVGAQYVLPLIKQEARSIYELPNDIENVKEKLEIIHKYLEKAEVLADENDDIKEQVKIVRSIMYQFEDVVDRYELLQNESNASICEGLTLMMKEIWRCFRQAVGCVKQLWPRHQIIINIREAKNKLESLNLKGNDGQVQVGETSQELEDPRILFRYNTDQSQLVGLDVPEKEIRKLLDLQYQKKKKRSCVAVTGMGGVGKTTLVRKVYDEIKGQFQLRAWVTVSRSYNKADILKSICQQFDESINVKEVEDIILIVDALWTYLQKHTEKSYIVVFDDVWNNELFQYINYGLSSNQEGSRILMTTRKEDVASYWANSLGGSYYKLKCLSERDAGLLFFKKVFNSDHCPDSALDKLTLEILKKCGRLPLVIITIAGLLSTKQRIVSEWRKVRDNLGREFRDAPDYESTKRIILYSYHELPYELKPCFLYLGMFPEDYQVEVETLIRIWIAEGFIKSERGYTIEELAEKYLNNLIRRGLLSFSEVEVFSSVNFAEKRYVKVHDILHEIILTKLEDLGFGEVQSRNYTSSRDVQCRRLSMQTSSAFEKRGFGSSNSYSTRSILIFHPKLVTSSVVFEKATWLRVLYIGERNTIDDISKDAADMENKRLLGSSNKPKLSEIQQLLESFISKLLNLETLEISTTGKIELPREISRLTKLQHLILKPYFRIPKGVLEKLTELRTLEKIDGSKPGVIDELQFLIHLRKLAIYKVHKKTGPAFFRALKEMTELGSLYVHWLSDNSLLDIDLMKLKSLHFLDPLANRTPRWVGDLNNLLSLSLQIEHSNDDQLQKLQHMHSLESLRIKFFMERMEFGSTGFRNLRSLVVHCAYNRPRIISGALPSLQKLVLKISEADNPVKEMPPHVRDVMTILRP